MDTTHCPFCKSLQFKDLYPTFDIFGNNYNISKCLICSCYFLSPNPTAAQLEKAYDSSYYGNKEEKFEGITERFIDYFRKVRAKRFAKNLPLNANILDIGCGNGRFLQHTLKYGNFNIYGIEMEGNSAKRAARIAELNLHIGVLTPDLYPPQTFDGISLFHVFEHLENAEQYLQIISRIIKPNGKLVISMPNIESLQARWFKGKWLHLDPPRHLLFFSAHELTKKLADFGFEKTKAYYFSIEQNPYGFIQSLLNVFCKKREVLFERLKGNDNYAAEYGKWNILFQKLWFMGSFPFFCFTDLLLSLTKQNATYEIHFRKMHE